MLNIGTFKHQMILITNSKVTLIMALLARPVEAWEALAAPNIIRQNMAATPKSQSFHSSFIAEAETGIWVTCLGKL